MILSWDFLVVEGLKILNISQHAVFGCHAFVTWDDKYTVLSAAKNSLTDCLILIGKRLVNDADSTFLVD